jgi:hypothetical protein
VEKSNNGERYHQLKFVFFLASLIPSSFLFTGCFIFQVKRRLRQFAEPITLFGETDDQRFERLKAVEVAKHEQSTSQYGRGNQYQQIQKVFLSCSCVVSASLDLCLLNHLSVFLNLRKYKKKLHEPLLQLWMVIRAMMTRARSLKKSDRKSKKNESHDTTQTSHERASIRQKNTFYISSRYLSFSLLFSSLFLSPLILDLLLQRMLREWELELDARPEDEKRSVQGKDAAANQKQARAYIKPFLKLLKQKVCLRFHSLFFFFLPLPLLIVVCSFLLL